MMFSNRRPSADATAIGHRLQAGAELPMPVPAPYWSYRPMPSAAGPPTEVGIFAPAGFGCRLWEPAGEIDKLDAMPLSP